MDSGTLEACPPKQESQLLDSVIERKKQCLLVEWAIDSVCTQSGCALVD